MNYENLSKEELIALVSKLNSKGGRKEEIKGILLEGKISISDISERTGMTSRNVSTILSYLRKDGLLLGKDSKGRLFIEDEE